LSPERLKAAVAHDVGDVMADETDKDPEQTAFELTDVLGGSKLEDGVGLCLSGGGFRAMLFHLGSLIRLNELGLLPKIDRVSSVSGGSLAAGILAAGWTSLGFGADGIATRFHDVVSEPLLRLARKRVDIPAIVLGFIPFVHAANIAARSYDRAVIRKKTLQDLPDRPRFVFTSTSLQTGVLWRFAREYAADWRVGQWDDPDLRLALAVAASAAFPPMLSPARIKPPKNSIRPWPEPTTLTAPTFRKRLFLTDGGVYDNLGLEPVWKRYRTLLVSDGGAVTQPVARPWTNWYSQFRRVLDVSLQQGINTRIRILHGLDRSNARTVAYWGIDTPVDSYGRGNPLGFSADMTHRVSIVPTRLTKFPKDTRLLIVRAGYAHTEAALSASRIPVPNRPASFDAIPDVG
jgi:NTE family protein